MDGIDAYGQKKKIFCIKCRIPCRPVGVLLQPFEEFVVLTFWSFVKRGVVYKKKDTVWEKGAE